MSKEQMLIARELIKDKKYAEARAILENIDHPKAKEWLAKLDAIAPAKAAAPPRQARPKPPAKPISDDDDPDAFLDEMMARKRPTPRPTVSPKAAAQQRKKPGRRYFMVYGLIFVLFLAGMMYGAVTFLGDDEDPDAKATTNAIETLNSEGLSMTATAAAAGFESSNEGTPDPLSTEEP